MPILELSFHHLKSPLKSCFSYCALFPKDFLIEKEMLISLWMAQGYIVPLDYGQNIGDAAEEYYSILLKRCFFHDIVKIDIGEIEACKIHDLMHDVAQSVSRKEIYALNNSNSGNFDNIKVRHLSVDESTSEYVEYLFGMNRIRSLLSVSSIECYHFPVETLVANCKCLRALSLSGIGIKSLPSSIGELLHLKYLDQSYNDNLEMLPNSITKLCNLQSLLLVYCKRLKELPKDLSRLLKLRVLNIEVCRRLTYMPRNMGKLTSLERLKGVYNLGGEGRCSSWEEWFYGVEDLYTLSNLKGKLEIVVNWPEKAKNMKATWNKESSRSWSLREELGSCLKGMEHLNYLALRLGYSGKFSDEGVMGLLMEELKPHYNLKSLCVIGYKCLKMPSWFNSATSLPHIVSLNVQHCEELEYLPLFPSLENLFLRNMPRLRGLGVEEENSSSSNSNRLEQFSLPCLTKLDLHQCPKLRCISIMAPKLRDMSLCKVACLDSMPIEALNSIERLCIDGDNAMKDLPNWIQNCSTLQQLEIKGCSKLESMPNWMLKLTSLQILTLHRC